MSQSLIDIEDNKLIINSKITTSNELYDTKIKVVSIIGRARGGKSTFLNCLLTYLEGENQNIFHMAKGDKHCTNGIDMYYLKERNIVMLDFQGIWVRNSANDSKLLLLAYLSSDVIISSSVCGIPSSLSLSSPATSGVDSVINTIKLESKNFFIKNL